MKGQTNTEGRCLSAQLCNNLVNIGLDRLETQFLTPCFWQDGHDPGGLHFHPGQTYRFAKAPLNTDSIDCGAKSGRDQNAPGKLVARLPDQGKTIPRKSLAFIE